MFRRDPLTGTGSRLPTGPGWEDEHTAAISLCLPASICCHE